MKKFIFVIVAILFLISPCFSQVNTGDYALCVKVWGYMKYHHPHVVVAKYDWDNQLIDLIGKVTDPADQATRNIIIADWIDQFGNVDAWDRMADVAVSDSIRVMPLLNWIRDTASLGKPLSDRLRKIENAQRPLKQFYAGSDPDCYGATIFTNENNYDTIPMDRSIRLIALARYWNWVEYYYPYRYLIEDWDRVLVDFIPQIMDASTPEQYRNVLRMVTARIQDTHIRLVEDNDPVLKAMLGTRAIPVCITFIEDKPIVTGVYDPQSALRTGDRITAIGGISAEEYIALNSKYLSASNPAAMQRRLAASMIRCNQESVPVGVQRGDEIFTCDVATSGDLEAVLVKQYGYDITRARQLDRGIGYIPAGISAKDYRHAFAKFSKGKGIVLDLRAHPQDDIEERLWNSFLDNKTSESSLIKATIVSYLYPGMMVYYDDPENGILRGCLNFH